MMEFRLRKIVQTFLLCLVLAATPGLDGKAYAADGEESPFIRKTIDKAKEDFSDMFGGLQLSAFGDFLSSYDEAEAGKRKLNWGSFELDAAMDLSHDLQAALAVVSTQGEGTELATGFLDYHTFGGRIAPRGRLWAEKGFHVQVGRFDVPFGNDWQFFASKDSVSISRPLTTDIVMDGGYNDKGIRVLGNNGSVNFNTYLLCGFGAGRLAGARLGLTPFNDQFSTKRAREPKIAEFGLSYLYDAGTGWKKSETAFAADAEVHMGDWSGRFEHMVRKKEPLPGGERTVLRGWHFSQEYALGETVAWQTKVFARYEQGVVQPAEIDTLGADAGDDRDVRVAAGSSTNLGGSDVLQLKFEVQHYRAATPNTRAMPGFSRGFMWFAQLVVVL